MDPKSFIVVEIDLPVCANTYGVAPCTASVPGTGAQKCFNTFRTCQDTPNYSGTTLTLRLCEPTEYLPYDAFPCLGTVKVTPGVIDPGASIGTRGRVQFTAGEFPTGDAFMDRYLGDRAYSPFSQGTFWAKLRARLPNLQRSPVRVMRGVLGEDLSTFTVEHYFVETFLVEADGVQFVAKDALSFCDPSKAQCPVLSTGRLDAAIDADDVSATLSPGGIGNAEYPASGELCLSGKEIVTFTRSGDTLTIVRGQQGTTAIEHDIDASVQIVQVFDGESVADIVYTLLVDFTPGVEASWCDLDAWLEDANTFIGHLYHRRIPAPASVASLLNELMETAGCSLWWDPVEQKVQFQTLRPVSPSAFVMDNSRMLAGSFRAKEQPDKRLSQHWTYYGLRDPTNKAEKESNFTRSVVKLDTDAETEYGGPALGKVLARWIRADNRPAAERLNAMKMARFRDPPRQAEGTLFSTSPYLPAMGEGVRVRDFSLQEPDGSASLVPFYVTAREPGPTEYRYRLEELTFDESQLDDSERAVFIDADGFNINLRDLYDDLYATVPGGATITFTVSPRAYVGGQVLGTPSIDVGDWPESPDIVLVIASATDTDAKVLGRGGDGGGYPGPSVSGEAGGTALYTRYPVTLRNYGTIGAGGGGGQARVGTDIPSNTFYAAGGGGGAGFNGYNSGGTRRGGLGGKYDGENGGTSSGGDGAVRPIGPGGEGGGLAQAGRFNTGAPGHSSAGIAIDGVSFVTFDVTGTIIGTQVN